MQIDIEILLITAAVLAAGAFIAWVVHRTSVRKLVRANGAMSAEVYRLNALEMELRSHIGVIEPAYTALLRLRDALQAMRAVWIDHAEVVPETGAPDAGSTRSGANERSCEHVLRQNMWVFEPEFVFTNLNRSSGQPLHSILAEHWNLQDTRKPDSKLGLDLTWRPDICGWCDPTAGVHGRDNPNERRYVVIELKNSREAVRWKWMDQCYAYALALMYSAEDLWGKRIECFVIGGSVPDGIHPIHSHFGANRDEYISVTPLTWSALYRRACIIAEAYLRLVETHQAGSAKQASAADVYGPTTH